ncbi:MAG: hypothetical protein V4772_09030 [Pseudomonadota bacterium]
MTSTHAQAAFVTLGAACTLLMAACTMTPQNPPLPMATMQIGGEAYVINQLTASTWTASAKASNKALPTTPASQAALRDAIEKTSGCKVSDSDYSRQGMQFDAQVECGSRLKN